MSPRWMLIARYPVHPSRSPQTQRRFAEPHVGSPGRQPWPLNHLPAQSRSAGWIDGCDAPSVPSTKAARQATVEQCRSQFVRVLVSSYTSLLCANTYFLASAQQYTTWHSLRREDEGYTI